MFVISAATLWVLRYQRTSHAKCEELTPVKL